MNASKAGSFFKGPLKFLISLKLAVVLIFMLIVSLAAGTILESRYGAAAAKIIVYDSVWFTIILLMLGVNVFSVAMSRLPWKKKHIGFLLTHLGIIMILTGSLITRYLMTDGQMVLVEGERSGTINLPEQRLQVHRMGDATTWSIRIPQKPFAWEGLEKIGTPGELPVTLYLSRFYPKAVSEESYRPAQEGPGVLKVNLHSSMVDQSFWLREDPTGLKGVNLGPATIGFSRPMEPVDQGAEKPELFLEFIKDGKTARIDLNEDMNLPYETHLEGTPYTITIDEMFSNAIVVDNKLEENRNAAQQWGNPAVKLRLTGPELEEKHHVFSNFPDFATFHGHQANASGMKILFHAPHVHDGTAQNELRFYKDADHLMYQVKSGEEIAGGEVEVGKSTPMGWMDFEFNVETYYPHGENVHEFEARDNTSTAEGVTTALQLTLKEDDEEVPVWLSLQESKNIKVGQNVYQVFFRQQEKNIGFELKLLDFEKKSYPGTNKAASFSSDVELIDSMRGVSREVTISMNEPLEYRGYKIYQSAFRERPGQADISIFSVGHDPGIPLNYLGALVLVSGILTMIWMQRGKSGKTKKVAS